MPTIVRPSQRPLYAGLADSQPVASGVQIVGGTDQFGRDISPRPGLPVPHDLLDTHDLGQLLFRRRKHPKQCAWRWVKRHKLPVEWVGREMRVTGLAVLNALKQRRGVRR
jgi:hypothetical protein